MFAGYRAGTGRSRPATATTGRSATEGPPTRSLGFYERDVVQTLFWARLPGDTLILTGTAIYVADLVRKRFVLRASEDDPAVDDMAVAEGIVGDDD